MKLTNFECSIRLEGSPTGRMSQVGQLLSAELLVLTADQWRPLKAEYWLARARIEVDFESDKRPVLPFVILGNVMSCYLSRGRLQ